LCGSSTRASASHRDLDIALGEELEHRQDGGQRAIRPTSTFFSTDSRFTRLWCWKIIATGCSPAPCSSCRHSLAVDQRPSGIRLPRPLMQRSKRGFARAARPEHDQELAGLHRQVDALQHGTPGIGSAFDLDHDGSSRSQLATTSS
jgi:hypothetical protein